MDAKYFVAKYIADQFRNEPRNIGVIVSKGDQLGSRFLGLDGDGQIDGRKLRTFDYPEVYRQWLDFWRSSLAVSDIDSIIRSSSGHYVVIDSGSVSDTGQDSAQAIANFMYSTLVSDGGWAEALTGLEPAEAPELSKLVDDVQRLFAQLDLFATDDSLAHPIRMGATVVGKRSIPHRPKFSQANGKIYAMEPIDFTVARKSQTMERAGRIAYMFSDLREANSECYSLIRISDQDRENVDVEYSLKMLGNESDIVDWLNETQRQSFVSERQKIAMSVS